MPTHRNLRFSVPHGRPPLRRSSGPSRCPRVSVPGTPLRDKRRGHVGTKGRAPTRRGRPRGSCSRGAPRLGCHLAGGGAAPPRSPAQKGPLLLRRFPPAPRRAALTAPPRPRPARPSLRARVVTCTRGRGHQPPSWLGAPGARAACGRPRGWEPGRCPWAMARRHLSPDLPEHFSVSLFLCKYTRGGEGPPARK